MIKFYHEIKKPYLAPLNNNTLFSIHWLGGFTDGVASFSIFNYKPRLIFENHLKNLNYLIELKIFLNFSNIFGTTKPRLNRSNYNATLS
jgi:hypothetical protein